MTIASLWKVPFTRIPIKFSLMLIAGGFLIFGAYGWYELQAEGNDLRRVVQQETILLGRSLQVAIENALRDRQLADVEETIKRLEWIDPSIDIWIYDRNGRQISPTNVVLPSAAVYKETLQTAVTSRTVVFLFDPPRHPKQALLALPLTEDNGALLGELLVVRPLLDMQRDLRDLRRSIIVSVCLFILTTTALGLILGSVYISRPLGRMAAAMQEVRQGNLQSALPVERQDEMGAVAVEFNAMVADLREARRRLEEEAESRRGLQRALQDADKLITIGQLSAGLAHEIGSPLQILKGRARTLLTQAHDPVKVRRNADILVEQTDRITRIVEQLLRFARRRPALVTKTALETTVKSVLDLMEYEAHRRGVALSCSGVADMPQVLVDADVLQQIVLNLIANALTATPRGGQVIMTVAHSALPSVTGGRPIPALRLVVADTGCGMSAEVREQLFEPFFTTRAAEGGTGLGLAVVKSLVKEQGGAITVESKSETGSRFTVDLPLHTPEAQREAVA